MCVYVVTVQPSAMPGGDTTDGGDVDRHADCVCTYECVCVVTGQPSAMSGGEMMDNAGQGQHADCVLCVS